MAISPTVVKIASLKIKLINSTSNKCEDTARVAISHDACLRMKPKQELDPIVGQLAQHNFYAFSLKYFQIDQTQVMQ
jgi:hypothetical protein